MIEVYCDGGAAPNPGYGSIGFVIQRKGKIIMEGYQYLGNKMTNNQCEFIAVANSLSCVLVNYQKAKKVKVYVDSKLVFGATAPEESKVHMNLHDKKLKVLYEILEKILKRFDEVQFVKIDREENKLADKLCQIGREQKKTKVVQHGP